MSLDSRQTCIVSRGSFIWKDNMGSTGSFQSERLEKVSYGWVYLAKISVPSILCPETIFKSEEQRKNINITAAMSNRTSTQDMNQEVHCRGVGLHNTSQERETLHLLYNSLKRFSVFQANGLEQFISQNINRERFWRNSISLL